MSDRGDFLARWHSGRTGLYPAAGRMTSTEQRATYARLGLDSAGNFPGRTARGHVVGSVRPPLEAWTCWLEPAGWVVVAPSGARIETGKTEAEARELVARHNEEEG